MMSEVNLYKVLGVPPSASADEIKSAYRDLVKRHHPDLFSSAGAKAKATEKLRHINEAYAVLGNSERRRRYDQEPASKPQRRPGRAAPPPPRRAARPVRGQAPARRKSITLPKLSFKFSKKWSGYSVAAATLVLFAVYIGRSEPRLAVTWTLWEKFEVSPVASEPATEVRHGWTRLSEHATSAECSGALRKIVKDDERAGSRAVFDEKAGTMAITVYVEKEGGQIPHDSAKAAPGETPPKTPGVTDTEGQPSALVDGAPADRPNAGRKRVRNLECRATQRLESDSLFQRALRRVGLSA